MGQPTVTHVKSSHCALQHLHSCCLLDPVTGKGRRGCGGSDGSGFQTKPVALDMQPARRAADRQGRGINSIQAGGVFMMRTKGLAALAFFTTTAFTAAPAWAEDL